MLLRLKMIAHVVFERAMVRIKSDGAVLSNAKGTSYITAFKFKGTGGNFVK